MCRRHDHALAKEVLEPDRPKFTDSGQGSSGQENREGATRIPKTETATYSGQGVAEWQPH